MHYTVLFALECLFYWHMLIPYEIIVLLVVFLKAIVLGHERLVRGCHDLCPQVLVSVCYDMVGTVRGCTPDHHRAPGCNPSLATEWRPWIGPGRVSRIRPPVAQGVEPYDNCFNCDNCFVDYWCDVSDLAQATISVTQTRQLLY